MQLAQIVIIALAIIAILSSYAVTFRQGWKAGETALQAKISNESNELLLWAEKGREAANRNLEDAISEISKNSNDGALAPVLADQLERMRRDKN